MNDGNVEITEIKIIKEKGRIQRYERITEQRK
jgi:hypothetical protein